MKEKVLVGIGVVLLLIVAIQSVFLYRMSGQIGSVNQQIEPNNSLTGKPSGNQLAPPGAQVLPNIDNNWNPFEQMQRMQIEMSKIFGDMRSNLYLRPDFDSMLKPFSFSPTLDIREEADQFVIKVDIPGSDESNINVRIDEQRLTISATTNKSNESRDQRSRFRSERFMGQFERSVDLPAPVLAEKMKTEYKDEVLTIMVPKA